MFIMRFDMRSPAASPAATSELYDAALEMAQWGEQHGCIQIVLSEHHACEDGYLPAPLLLAAAMAGRTRSVALQIGALVLPLHDPIALAEQMAVLDLASGGRVSYVLAVGYRPQEYAMFGRSYAGRGRRMEDCVAALRQAWTGEPFEFEGRPLRVTPTPLRAEGPGLLMGGNSPRIARRAAQLGIGLLTQGGRPELAEIYRAECERLGSTPGLCIVPPPGTITSAFVDSDPDRAWSELGPYLLHDARSYAAWAANLRPAAPPVLPETPEALRASESSYRIFTPEQAIEYVRERHVLVTHPLCGGLPPDLAWRSLECMARDVLPQLGRS